jgi:tRNA isopentenyl-2-thiomethyl-A-37 hydroxylase MiaE
LEDPIKNDELGVFENEELQTLYDGLIETGNKSLIDALMVGAAIEEIDILDLIKYTEQIDNEDITFVYDNLNRGSRNHLRAFVKNLQNQGVDYEAHYMTQEAFEAIINSNMEKGGKNKKGKGKKGNGNGGRGGRG